MTVLFTFLFMLQHLAHTGIPRLLYFSLLCFTDAGVFAVFCVSCFIFQKLKVCVATLSQASLSESFLQHYLLTFSPCVMFW